MTHHTCIVVIVLTYYFLLHLNTYMAGSGGANSSTMDGGGGASFVTIATKRTRRASATTLVAVGKSHLSYFYVAVCSSVLYVAPGASNDAVLFRGDGDAAVALEVSYHKPARAADLRWATRAFVERNLEDGEAYGDLPDAMRRHLAQFNSLVSRWTLAIARKYRIDAHMLSLPRSVRKRKTGRSVFAELCPGKRNEPLLERQSIRVRWDGSAIGAAATAGAADL